MDKKLLTNKKAMSVIIAITVIVLLVVCFSTDLFSRIFNRKEYKAYKYAIACVEKELKYPETATYPSFKDATIKKSKYGTEIIIDTYTIGYTGGSFEYAWDISGYGTCENSLGWTMNYRFMVTVVLDEDGDLWCYKCEMN